MSIFTDWLARQSLPRFLGLFLGNTRDLELRLAEKDREAERLREDIVWLRTTYIGLTDSFLLSRGQKPVATEAAVASTTIKRNGSRPITIADKLAVDIEVDKLVELMYFDPAGADQRVQDLIASPNARDKEILRRYEIRLEEDLPDDGPGVVIGPAATTHYDTPPL